MTYFDLEWVVPLLSLSFSHFSKDLVSSQDMAEAAGCQVDQKASQGLM